MNRTLAHIPSIAALLLALVAPLKGHADAPLSVLATVGMVADVAAEVGGPCTAVDTLVGPGLDPHVYQAAAADVGRLQNAQAILYVGFGLEGQLGSILQRISASRPTLAVGPASVPQEDLLAVQALDGVDPHLWMDVRLWALTVPVLADFLSELAPSCAPDIAARADTYQSQLADLHAWVQEAIASIPEGQRYLVTAHDAFSYYARAYGLEEVSIQGISTDAEASIADIRRTAALVAEAAVPSIFVETTVNPRTTQAVLDAAAELGHEARIGGTLYSDALGEPGSPGDTYIGMIVANTRAIVLGLGGTPPPLPATVAAWTEERGHPLE